MSIALGDQDAALLAWASGRRRARDRGGRRARRGTGTRRFLEAGAVTVLLVAPGVLVAAARPRNPLGWLMLAVALLRRHRAR